MPGPGTHTTIIQRLAKAANDRGDPAARFLTDPNLNARWETYDSSSALQARYAVLGSMGPDIFYALLDYEDGVLDLQDTVIKILGTFRCVGDLSRQVNNLVDSELDDFTHGVWSELQRSAVLVKNVMVGGLLDALVSRHNFWSFYLPLRQLDDVQANWYWGDFLHYVKTGCFTQKLLDNAAALNAALPGSPEARCMSAYALGYLSHYVADTTGHPWVNRIVESPYRNAWQRHHLVENFIDAQVWATWHDVGGAAAHPADDDNLDLTRASAGDPTRSGTASFVSSRLDELCNIGSAGIDPIIDKAVSSVAQMIQSGLFNLGLARVKTLDTPDDPLFTTWTEFVADALYQTYPPAQSHPNRLSRYPSGADIASAYGTYRLLLSLQTGGDVEPPMMPDIAGDLAAILDGMWNKVLSDLGSVPPPPAPASSSSFTARELLDALKSLGDWLGQVIDSTVKALGDLIDGLIDAGVAAAADTIKAALYLLNSALYSAYKALHMTLVMSAYAAPTTADLTAIWGVLDLRTLWTIPDESANVPPYPIEPVLSQRDLTTDPSHGYSPYRPYMKPSTMGPVNVEQPATSWPGQVLAWTTPDDMLDSGVPGTHDMFSASGPAAAVTVAAPGPAGSSAVDLETFESTQRYFGSVMANCERALSFAVPYLSGTAYPAGVLLPDYNLDADRGYGWPAWDVDYGGSFPWNGCDPYPADTIAVRRKGIPLEIVKTHGEINGTDPSGNPRSGTAWVNARSLSTPGNCAFATFSLPSFIVDPRADDARQRTEIDVCGSTVVSSAEPGGGMLGPDHHVAPARFLRSDVNSPAPHDDIVNIYLRLPYGGSTTNENDGRLHDFLRRAAELADPRSILATAVSIRLGRGTPTPFGDPATVTAGGPDPELARALAQLAVTGRRAFDAFSAWQPQDQDLIEAYDDIFGRGRVSRTAVTNSSKAVLDDAYRALWAIRSNEPKWRAERSAMDWIATSGFDDTPHRPVNVPTSPYPQFDLSFTVTPSKGAPVPVTTRYTIASAQGWVGPWDEPPASPGTTVFTNPDPTILGAPDPSRATGRVPRAVPADVPAVSPTAKIIVYVPGGGSRAEEAVDMANHFITQAAGNGEEIAVICLDMPNNGYSARLSVSEVAGTPWDHHDRAVFDFEWRWIIAFIEQLDATLGNISSRVVAVMGGSLGGNTTLKLASMYDAAQRPYLETIVSWSVTAAAPAYFLGGIPAADVALLTQDMRDQVTRPEPFDDHDTEVAHFERIYAEPLSKELGIPPQPVTWYRGGYGPDGLLGWQPCKDIAITRSRFDRYETYSPLERQWMVALNLEQISFSFNDEPLLVIDPAVNLMLVAGEHDNFFPTGIYNSTIDLARRLRDVAHGRAEFWLDTGHSIHAERPELFVQEILEFLANPRSGASTRAATLVTAAPKARYSGVNL